MDYFGKIVDIFVAIIVMFVFPLMWASQKQDSLYMRNAANAVDAMCEEISNKGYLDKDMYVRLVNAISADGGVYDVEFVHTQTLYVKNAAGETVPYEDKLYTKAVMEALDGDLQAYFFEKGDQLEVSITKKTRSIGQIFMNMLYKAENSRYYIATASINGQSDKYREMLANR